MIQSLSIITAIILFLGYYVMYLTHHGTAPVSLSDTYYNVKNRWKFSVWLIVLTALVYVPWIEASERLEFLVFFACFANLLVAASPQFKDDFVGKVHYGAAGVMFVCTLIWEITNGGLFVILGLFCIFALINRSRWVLWLEFGLFLDLCFSLIVKLAA